MDKGSLIVTWILVAMVLYVLSIGPAARLTQLGLIPRSVAVTLYAPALSLFYVPGAGTLLNHYMLWWTTEPAPASPTHSK